MLPYFLILLIWYPLAVALPLIQSLHALQLKPADGAKLRKIWLFYWVCFAVLSVTYCYVEWLIYIPFFLISSFLDIYYEAQLVLVALLVLPKTFMVKKVFVYCESNGPIILETLSLVLWNATLVICMLPTCYLASALGNLYLNQLSKEKRASVEKYVNEACIAVTCLCWRFVTMLCFWVRIDCDGLDAFRSQMGASGRPCVIIANHNSFMDIILSVVLTPLSQVVTVKMLISAHVFKMPCVGTIASSMGHLSIPFKAAAADSKEMTVDKEAVKQRMSVLTEHLKNGGNAAWFPEGTINRGDTHCCQTFRAGGFNPIVQVDAEIWCLAQVGNSKFWPARAPVGGKPCKIGYKIFRLCESSHAFTENEKDDRAKELLIANTAQKKVQSALDDLVAKGYSGVSSTAKPSKGVPKKINISIIQARGLQSLNFTGDNIYCECEVAGKSWSTSKIQGSLEPSWNASHEMEFPTSAEKITIKILDEGALAAKSQGKVEVLKERFIPSAFEGELPITGCDGGWLKLKVEPVF